MFNNDNLFLNKKKVFSKNNFSCLLKITLFITKGAVKINR